MAGAKAARCLSPARIIATRLNQLREMSERRTKRGVTPLSPVARAQVAKQVMQLEAAIESRMAGGKMVTVALPDGLHPEIKEYLEKAFARLMNRQQAFIAGKNVRKIA